MSVLIFFSPSWRHLSQSLLRPIIPYYISLRLSIEASSFSSRRLGCYAPIPLRSVSDLACSGLAFGTTMVKTKFPCVALSQSSCCTSYAEAVMP